MRMDGTGVMAADGVDLRERLRAGEAVAGKEGLWVRSPVSGRTLLIVAMTDLDGTVNDEHVVERERLGTIAPAREALGRLTAAGWSVGICTARSTGEARMYRLELGIDGPLISENGAVVTFADGSVELLGGREPLERAVERIGEELGRPVLSTLDPAGVEALWEAEVDGRVAVQLGHADRASLRRAMDRRASCFLVGLSEDEKRRARRVAGELGLDSFGQLLHLIPAGAHKGAALERLLARLESGPDEGGLRPDRVVPVVFGNGENDLPLFSEALRRGGAAVLVGDARSATGFHFDPAEHPVPEGTLSFPGLPHGHGIRASLPRLAAFFAERYAVRFPW